MIPDISPVQPASPARRPAVWSLLLFLFSLGIILPGVVHAQKIDSIGNKFVVAKVVTSPKSGQFWMTTRSLTPGDGRWKFLFESLSGSMVTTNVVFRVVREGQEDFYCNVPENAPFRPQVPGKPGYKIPFEQFDSLYTSKDTLAVTWWNIGGYDVTMRFVPERPRTDYDTGGDILVEFYWNLRPNTNHADFGILLMLDTYNANANGSGPGGAGDRSAVLTDQGYFPPDGGLSALFTPASRIPEFYHVGNFRSQAPLDTVFSVHRLRGLSQGGAQLHPPDLLAIGDWVQFRYISWDMTSFVTSNSFVDCASILRWESLPAEGTRRTALGKSNKWGNNFWTCRDSTLFFEFRSVKVVEQKTAGGPYTPSQVDVEMWVTNTDEAYHTNANVIMDDPIESRPTFSRRLTLASPRSLGISLAPRETQKFMWRLNINEASRDTLVRLNMQVKWPNKPLSVMPKELCSPTILVHGYVEPPPPREDDTMAPVIQFVSSGRTSTAFWNFRTFDRHPGYKYDSGLSTISVRSGANFTLVPTPVSFKRCDTTVNVDIRLEVTDTSRPGNIVFVVRDCAGNESVDSVSYQPRPDIFTPEISRIDTSGSAGPPCNVRRYELEVVDSRNQTAEYGDYGLGSITVIGTPDNFAPIEINYDRGNAAIQQFDARATFRTHVLDTMFNGSITIELRDFAGNDTTITLTYCTLPDVRAPIAVRTTLADGKSWTIEASDTLGWDRGLKDVVVLKNTNSNMAFVMNPVVNTGDETVMFDVKVVDDSQDGEIVIEIQDTYYETQPEGHADTITIFYSKTPDQLAPNIVYNAVAGTNGATVDVDVNDIHYVSGDLYKYDLGLSDVRIIKMTPNIILVTPISFTKGAMSTTFQVRVVDTLSLGISDTIGVEATDLAGNIDTNYYYYPIVPDEQSPIFTGSMNADRSAIGMFSSDMREYDRGLGSIQIENPVNLDASFSVSYSGADSGTTSITVIDPTQPISGTFVLTDLIGDLGIGPNATTIHTTRIPFSLPVLGLRVTPPRTIEGGDELAVALVMTEDLIHTGIAGSEVKSIEVEVDYSGDAAYNRADGIKGALSAIAGGGSLQIRYEPIAGTSYNRGDTIGFLRFTTERAMSIGEFKIGVRPQSVSVNDDVWTDILLRKTGDTAISVLRLPPPLLKLSADSMTYINGECERILTTTGRTQSKPGALAILGVKPQPISIDAAGALEIDVRNLPQRGARAELIAVDGRTVAQVDLEGSGHELVRVRLPLPAELSSGMYIVRVSGASGVEHVPIVVRD